ncbi:MAG TPA: hypothetical protein P5556_07680 [Candidatus Gastranaerophilales bacterium]|nr:hypothetical protein [Candidatus Gastranaerophilales bacterium]
MDKLKKWLTDNGFIINKYGNVYPIEANEQRGYRVMAFKENGLLGFRNTQIKRLKTTFSEDMFEHDERTMNLRLDPKKVRFEKIISIILELRDKLELQKEN